jgi:hypothetical protein
MAKKTKSSASSTKISSQELFKKHKHLKWLLPLFILVVIFSFMFQKNVNTNSVNMQTSQVNSMANWKTYANTKYGFNFKYPQNMNIVLPSLADYKYAPDQADMIIPEKTRDITLASGGKSLLQILVLPNANSTIQEIKKNPTQGGGAPVKNLTDTKVDNIPAITYQLDCAGLTGCSEGPYVTTVHNNTEYLFTLLNAKVSDQVLSTFKFTN